MKTALLQVLAQKKTPVSSACWEGTMTVGGTPPLYGWDETLSIGSMTNLSAENCMYDIIQRIYYDDNFGELYVSNEYYTAFVNTIEIDGTVYNMAGNTYISVGSNPFPAIGLTCLIRILS